MVKVEQLKKVYKLSKKQQVKEGITSDKKIAVNDVSFEAKPGEIFGLLGPNGAGKTTTLRTVSTLIQPTSGRISVMGYDVQKESMDVRRNICFLTNELKLDTHFTPDYTIHYFGSLHGMDKTLIEERKQILFKEFGIDQFKDMKISELSTGMKQKLSIAVSLIHDPNVVIFDEPTNGLDIITAKAVTNYLMKMKEEGKVVIVSTHIMSVASKMCDRIGILIGGKLRILGTLDEILNETGCDDLEDAFFKMYNAIEGGRNE